MLPGSVAERTEPATSSPTDAPTRWSRPAAIVIAVLAAACGAQAIAWVLAGQANGDEGWYLYDATLALRGQLPYRDFAFTQTPLTLFVYGPAQVLTHSLVVGRVVSAVLALAGIGLCARVIARRVGPWATVAYLAMVLAFPIGFYNLTLVKTYALALLLLSGCLTALTASRGVRFRYPAATACAVALVLTRTTGIFVLVPVVVVGLVVGDAVTRRRIVGIVGLGALVGLAFVLTDPAAASFSIAGFHQVLWFDLPMGERLSTIVQVRVPDWLSTYWPFVALGALTVAAMGLTRRGRALCREETAWPLMLVGLSGFLVSQLSAGQFAPVEYFAPAAPILLAISVVVLAVVGASYGWPRVVRTGVAVGAVVVFSALSLTMPNAPGASWQAYVAGRDGPRSVEWINEVADELRAVTGPGDQVLALHLQSVLLAADRVAPTGVSMGVFSYTDMTTERAEQLGWVNRDILVGLLERREPAAVVFDAVDWAVLEHGGTLSLQPGDARPVRDALEASYRQVPTSVEGAEIWVRR